MFEVPTNLDDLLKHISEATPKKNLKFFQDFVDEHVTDDSEIVIMVKNGTERLKFALVNVSTQDAVKHMTKLLALQVERM